MEKQEMIIELINLYDEIEGLKRKNERLEAVNASNELKGENCLKPIDYLMIEEGKKVILKDCLDKWESCRVTYNEDADTYVVDCYEKWYDKKIIRNNIPNSISYDEFISYFEKDLWTTYENEKIKAFNSAKKEKE